MDVEERKLSSEELAELSGVPIRSPRPQGSKLNQKYMATVPLRWLQIAACLPGRTLHVAIAIWHLHRLEKSPVVALTPAKLRRFGVHRNTAIASLERLESAGLVSVKRSTGRAPRVTVCQMTDDRLKREG
jgi:hypothetical protein